MHIGMLWYDNDPDADLAAKIKRAAEYYQNRYNKAPNLCFVNPAQAGSVGQVGAVEIRPSRQVLVNHLWIGVDAAKAEMPGC